MFERCSEALRRAIFFSRHEAAITGSQTIESEHLLLGLLYDKGNTAEKLFKLRSHEDGIRKRVTAERGSQKALPKDADLPLSNEAKRVLAYAFEEAERLSDEWIDTEHLVLGILRERNSFAAEILRGLDLTLEAARETLVHNGAARPDYGPGPILKPPPLTLRILAWLAVSAFLATGIIAALYIAYSVYRMLR